MCIRDRAASGGVLDIFNTFSGGSLERMSIIALGVMPYITCLLYTSDAADERSSVDLGGRRIIKKKNNRTNMTTEDDCTRHTVVM